MIQGSETHQDFLKQSKFCYDLCEKNHESKAALKKHMKKHVEKVIETDHLVSDIAEACENTPMILM